MFKNFKVFFSTEELQLKIIFDIDRVPCSCTSLKDHGKTAQIGRKTFVGFHRDAINDKN